MSHHIRALAHSPLIRDGEGLCDFGRDLLAGLSARPKRLPPKYFYDGPGSQLFERITQLPEYYPTRTELSILGARVQTHKIVGFGLRS